ncbi:MAG: flagellar basal body P-ring formation protein FlgA [Salinarimonas sp.]|nr:flagellar basal body P-ring formation protein FlgA [Salinarimonas sp.]
MSLDHRIQPLGAQRCARIGLGLIARVAGFILAITLVVALTAPALAINGTGEPEPRLRGDVTVDSDVVTIGDLLADVPDDVADIAAFRAPDLGEDGTIATARILAAAEQLGLRKPQTFGRSEVHITRAAREIDENEIAAALAEAIGTHAGKPSDAIEIRFEGRSPHMRVPPHATGAVEVTDLRYDPSSGRLAALVYIGESASRRIGQAMVTARAVTTVEIAVLERPLSRGDRIEAADLRIERRPAANIPQDAWYSGLDLEERVARRNLAAGHALRSGDLARENLVDRGQNVMIIYRSRNLTLTMRGTANESGTRGQVIAVTNPQSKRVLQATVSGQGQVTVDAPSFGPVAATPRIIQ